MPIDRPSRRPRFLLRAALGLAVPIGLAPALVGTVTSSASTSGGDIDGAGPEVVQRLVSSDVVVDWLEAPPAEALAWLDEPEAPLDHGAAADHDHHDRDDDHDWGVTHAEAVSTSGGSETAAPGQGFTVFSPTSRLLRSGYTIRLTGNDARVEQYRPDLEAAARAATAASGISIRVAPGRGGSATPSRGEITAVIGHGPCGAPAIGCGGPALTATELVSGRVWLAASGLSRSQADRRNLTAHELGHALGLGHHSGGWSDGRQVMYPQIFGLPTYRAGDGRGLKFMAGGYDRPAGSIADRRYAAGQVHVAGVLTTGSRVRVTVGQRSTDVTAVAGRFAAAVPAGPGDHRVCTVSLDAAPGFHRTLGCADVHAPGAPFGRLEAVGSSFETIHVGGWAIDPQSAAPIDVEIRRNGTVVATTTASTTRPDVGAAYRRYGADHGFSVDVPAVAGRNEICVRALGVGGGGDKDLGCGAADHAVDPVGAFEVIHDAELGAVVTGWALDPNTPAAVQVTVSIDGAVPAVPGSFRAAGGREDVARRYPAHGPQHGFSQRLVLSPGEHVVCLTVANVGLGTDRSLGCRDVRASGVEEVLAGAATGDAALVGDLAGEVLGSASSALDGVVASVTGNLGGVLSDR